MKKLVLIIGLLATATLTSAQNSIQRDSTGNWIQTNTVQEHDSLTRYTAKLKGKQEEPVYIGKRGGYYVARISKKSGKYYRKYLKD